MVSKVSYFVLRVLKLPLSLFSARNPINKAKPVIQLKIAFACSILALSTPAFSIDVLKLSDKEFESLSEEQLDKLPAIEAIMKDSIKHSKNSVDQSAVTKSRNAFIFLIENALYELKYYIAIPHGEESPVLTKAIIDFQKNIGAAPRGILLWKEFITLSDKTSLIWPGKVQLPPFNHVVALPTYVSAEGTWVFEDNTPQLNPIQTSKINCSKDTMECEEIFAQIDEENRLLNLFTDHYQITKWTNDEVVAENDAPKCVSYTLTINFRKEQTHSFRRGKGGKDCAGIAEKPQIIRLENGFDVSQKYYKNRDREALSAYNPEFSKH